MSRMTTSTGPGPRGGAVRCHGQATQDRALASTGGRMPVRTRQGGNAMDAESAHDTGRVERPEDNPIRFAAPAQLVDRKNAADYIAEVLRDAICTGGLPDGTVLNQVDLANQFGVSRIPMREALRLLQSEGLVEFRPRQQAVVATLTPSALSEIYEIRELFECHLLGLAFEHIGDAILAQLNELADRMEASDDERNWLPLTREFHRVLLQPADRPVMLEGVHRYRRLGERYLFFASDQRTQRRHEANKEHRTIIAAIEDKDLQTCVHALRGHIRVASSHARSSLTR